MLLTMKTLIMIIAIFVSHFYDSDNGKTYIPYAKQAKETGAKYFKLAGESYKNKDMKQAFFI